MKKYSFSDLFIPIHPKIDNLFPFIFYFNFITKNTQSQHTQSQQPQHKQHNNHNHDKNQNHNHATQLNLQHKK